MGKMNKEEFSLQKKKLKNDEIILIKRKIRFNLRVSKSKLSQFEKEKRKLTKEKGKNLSEVILIQQKIHVLKNLFLKLNKVKKELSFRGNKLKQSLNKIFKKIDSEQIRLKNFEIQLKEFI
jgi:hypothetical protein